MYIRLTRKEEVEEVVKIIDAAAEFIASQGSPQWQNGQKPTKETILNDIERKKLAKPFLEHLLTIAASKDIQDVRIDTYPANEPMEKTIYSAGFTYQGMIEFPFEHGERKAYQKIIK